MRDLVAITAFQTFLNPRRIDFNAEKERAIHGRRERLGAAHATKSASQNKSSFERSSKMFSTCGSKSFERALHDSLTANINPRTGSHLAVHREAKSFQPIE